MPPTPVSPNTLSPNSPGVSGNHGTPIGYDYHHNPIYDPNYKGAIYDVKGVMIRAAVLGYRIDGTRTGDDANLKLWILLAACSMIIIAYFITEQLKKRRAAAAAATDDTADTIDEADAARFKG